MKKTKTFDCIQMKDRLQEAMLKEYSGLNDEQKRKKMHDWLEKSDDPLAQKWQRLIDKMPHNAGASRS